MYIKHVRKVKVLGDELELKDDSIETIFEKGVTKFGNGAKIDCPKKYTGHRAYVIIRKKR